MDLLHIFLCLVWGYLPISASYLMYDYLSLYYQKLNKMDAYRIIVTGVSRGLGKDLLGLILKNNPDFHVIGTVRTDAEHFEKELKQKYHNANLHIMVVDLCAK